MKETFTSHFEQIDDLLGDIESSTSHEGLLAEIDDLCSEIETAVDDRKNEVLEWPDARKRQEASDSRDPYVLNLLSMDESFNVRTLSACNPELPATSLRRLAENSNDYVRMVIAHNPATSPEILDRIVELSGEQEVLEAVKANPNASPVVLYKIQNRMV